MLVLSLLGLMSVEGMAQSLYSSCSSSEDCGDHQVCDLQGRKECQCLPDYHVSSMECIRAVGRGEPCTEEISCRLADRSLRCTTSPGHSLPSCQCKEDTRWVQPPPAHPHQPCPGGTGPGVCREEVRRRRDRASVLQRERWQLHLRETPRPPSS